MRTMNFKKFSSNLILKIEDLFGEKEFMQKLVIQYSLTYK
jgi:hypothetical protein